MKKIISFLIISAVVLTSLAFLFYYNDGTYKVGVGIYASASQAEATDKKPKSVLTEYTFAALIIDRRGRVVDCDLDASAEGAVTVTEEGKTAVEKPITTKVTLGDAYGMQMYANATEWYIQADRFEKLVKGKTLDQIKNLVVTSGEDKGKGKSEVISAGCTITVSEFVLAIEKAFVNAKTVELGKTDKEDEIKASLGVAVSSKGNDASGEKAGEATFNGVATAAFKLNGKLVSCITDELEVKLSVSSEGAVGEISDSYESKRELGASYGMIDASPIKKEWYEQIDALDKACEGKTSEEILGLMNYTDHYGYVDAVAGCTVYAGNFIKAISNAAK